ncbi:MAG: flagellar hook-length control protein FliK [Clostridiales bacterium]|jgi:flagellar hook-length control protein FliK|nr:flagellar hook-length control protein FliK [Clostridiales bacterium]
MQIQAIPFLTKALQPQNNKQSPGKTGFPPSPFLALLASMLQQTDAPLNGLITTPDTSLGDNPLALELNMMNHDEEQEAEMESNLQIPPLYTPIVPVELTNAQEKTEQVAQVSVMPGDSTRQLEMTGPLQQQMTGQEVAVDEGSEETPERKVAGKPNEAGKSAKQFPPEAERPIQAAGRGQSLRFQAEQVKELPNREKTEQTTLNNTGFSARIAMETPAALYGKVNVERAAVLEQVLEKMVLNKDENGESRIFIRLKPAVLGEVEIRLRMENGQLSGSILAQNSQVKEVLETAMAQLRQRLEAQQIQVAELTVTVGQEQGFQQDRGFTGLPWEQGMAKKFGVPNADLDEMPLPAGILQGLIDARA